MSLIVNEGACNSRLYVSFLVAFAMACLLSCNSVRVLFDAIFVSLLVVLCSYCSLLCRLGYLLLVWDVAGCCVRSITCCCVPTLYYVRLLCY
jgi:hypothetical protein